jgi:hypothetical protein
MSLAVVLLAGCKLGNADRHSEDKNQAPQQPPVAAERKEVRPKSEPVKAKEERLNENWLSSNDVKSGITEKTKEKGVEVVDFLKLIDEKLITSSNKNVGVYSFKQNKSCALAAVVFLRDDPQENMRDFIQVVNECSKQLFIEPDLEDKLMGIFLGFSTDGEAVCGFSMYPQEQVFSLKGFDFVSEKASLYQKGYDALVREKTGKKSISEWDYFLFRSEMTSDPENLSDLMDRIHVGIAGPNMMTLYKLRGGTIDLLLQNKATAEALFSATTDNQTSKDIMGIGFSINTLWFDSGGKRIMAELARKLPSGKIDKERKWYNGYSMPK